MDLLSLWCIPKSIHYLLKYLTAVQHYILALQMLQIKYRPTHNYIQHKQRILKIYTLEGFGFLSNS